MRSEVYALDDRAKVVITWPGDVSLNSMEASRLMDWMRLIQDKILTHVVLALEPPAPWPPGEPEELSKVDFIDPGPPEPRDRATLHAIQAAADQYNLDHSGTPYMVMVNMQRVGDEEPEPPLLRPEPLKKCPSTFQVSRTAPTSRCNRTSAHTGLCSDYTYTWRPGDGYHDPATLQREADLSSRIPHDYLADQRPDVLSQMRQAEPGLFGAMVPELADAMIPPGHRTDVLSVIDEARNEFENAFSKAEATVALDKNRCECGREFDSKWPGDSGAEVCQTCWERQSSAAWWRTHGGLYRDPGPGGK